MSCNWPTVTVEDIASKLPNALATGPFGSAISSKFFTDSGVPVIRGSNLSADTGVRLKDEGIVFVSEEKSKEFTRSVARVGDLVFTCWGTINQVGYIDGTSSWDEYIISNKQMKLTVDTTKVDPRFLYYVFSSPLKQQEILSNGIGAAVPGFNLGQLRKHTLQLPPLIAQSAIADTLELLDKKANQNTQINQTLEEMAQAIFKSWFVNFDPVKAKMNGEQPEGMDTATASLFPEKLVDTEVGELPEGWKLVPVGELLDKTIGGDWGKEEPDDKHTEVVRIVRGTDIPKLHGGAIASVPVRYVESKKLKTRKLERGDIVIEVSGGSKDQPTGRSLFISDNILKRLELPSEPASFCRRFKPKNYETGLLLTVHFQLMYQAGKTWEYQNQSTGISNFQTKYFLEAEHIVIPSDDVLDAFVKQVSPMMDMIHSNQNIELANLRDTLLPKLLSGEIDLETTEELVEVN